MRCLLSALASLLFTTTLLAARQDDTVKLRCGEAAPPLTMTTVSGREIELHDLLGREVVLLFGEAGHDKTTTAAGQIAEALRSEELRDRTVEWVTIYSKSSQEGQIEHDAAKLVPRPLLVHDRDRLAFGAYGVIAMPTAAVIDAQGRIVHVIAGASPRFGAVIAASLQYAAGTITAKQHEQIVQGMAPRRDAALERAERHAGLARRLHMRGQFEMAEAEYRRALETTEIISARLGLGDLLIRMERLDDAEEQYRAVLDVHPRSLEGSSGLAHVYALRGGNDLGRAEALAREVVNRGPHRARAYFVMGIVHEKRGEMTAAAHAYRQAAELLLERASPEEEIRE